MKAMQEDYEEKLRQQNESHLRAIEEMKQAYEAKLQEVRSHIDLVLLHTTPLIIIVICI